MFLIFFNTDLSETEESFLSQIQLLKQLFRAHKSTLLIWKLTHHNYHRIFKHSSLLNL